MYHICIIDDEPKAAEVIEALLNIYFSDEINTIDIFTDSDKAVQFLDQHDPDLIFLDIKMPKLDGIEMLKKYESRHLNFILVTAYDQYTIDAIRHNAMDYLIKPVDDEDFINAIERFKIRYEDHKAFSSKDNNHGPKNKIALQKGDQTFFHDINEIIRCEAKSNYTYFFLSNGQKLLSSKTLKQYDEFLVYQGFLRVHKSHLINMSFVSSVLKGGEILMTNGDIIPIAKRRKKETGEALMNNLHLEKPSNKNG